MTDAYRLSTHDVITAFDREAWNGLANPGWTLSGRGAIASAVGEEPPRPFNPFITHEFLAVCESSGCVGERQGWAPNHIALETESGTLVGVVPAYLKSHSFGEYVFDHGWADAYERLGRPYYPKLQVSVPFTPVSGPRLLVADPAKALTLARGVAMVADHLDLSSAHVTFATEDDGAALEEQGFLARTDLQFHFRNPGYGCYDDFLAELSSRKRKALKRERRDALQDDITVEWVTGNDLTEAHWDAFFAFYTDTGNRKWGRPYLNRRFFSEVSQVLAERILLVMARRNGRYIAGALNFIGSDTLYGRNWGALEEHPFLHFELCYHQAIDFAIANGIGTVEAGAQGEHKLARGYMPTLTRSYHYLSDTRFRGAVAAFLDQERLAVDASCNELTTQGPFRHED